MESAHPGRLPEAVARIIDASANRAREGIRLAEDVARFALDREDLAGALREARHQLTRGLVEAGVGDGELLAARDTPHDVGTRAQGPDGRGTGNLVPAVRAAFGRAQQALRVLEESCATAGVPAAGTMASLRYRLYDLERRLLQSGLRPELVPRRPRVYLIWDLEVCGDRDPLAVLAGALAGGAEWVQLRSKTTPDGAFLEVASRARELTRRHGAALLVNDRLAVAQLCDADGVHLGPDDLPARAARRLLGPRVILGATTHSEADLEALRLEPVDYMGFGPIGATATKVGALPPLGVEAFRALPAEWRPRVVPIGGIDARLAAELAGTGARQVAVGGAILRSDDPEAATRAILAAMSGATSR
jgi:thiamine-phosphate pyrophosphorylase